MRMELEPSVEIYGMRGRVCVMHMIILVIVIIDVVACSLACFVPGQLRRFLLLSRMRLRTRLFYALTAIFVSFRRYAHNGQTHH